jgi:hypothetical protein
MLKDLFLLSLPFIYVYVFYCGFLMYASVMNVGWGKLPLFLKVVLAPVGSVFLLMDIAFNLTVGSLLFLQLPPTWTPPTLSMRMAHNIAAVPTTWRGKLSALIVNNLLLPFTKDY